MTPKSSRPSSNRRRRLSAATWAGLALLVWAGLSLVGCANDYSLIEQTLDARVQAMNEKDIEAYLACLSPDYIAARPDYDPRSEMSAIFEQAAQVEFHNYNRELDFSEERGDLVTVRQDYQWVLRTAAGRPLPQKGIEQFQLKRHGFGPFKKWLIVQGLDQSAE